MIFIPLFSLKDQFDRALNEKDIKPALKLSIRFSALHSMKSL